MPMIAPPTTPADLAAPAAYYQGLPLQAAVAISGPNGEFADITVTPNGPPTKYGTLFAMTGGFASFFPAGEAVPSPDNILAPVDLLLLVVWPGDVLAQKKVFPPDVPALGHIYYLGADAVATKPLLRVQVDTMSTSALQASWKVHMGPPAPTLRADLIDKHLDYVMQGRAGVFVDGGAPIGQAILDNTLAAPAYKITIRMSNCDAPLSYVSPLPIFRGAPYFAPNAVTRTDLVDHPLRLEAAKVVMNCTIKANFKTFDPVAYTRKPLANARINLVCSDSAIAALAGETDASGDLYSAGTLGTRLVVPNVQALAPDAEFHFEADLTAMSYPVGSQFIPFPIATWSTKGWREPTGQMGHFKLAGNAFPALPERQFFTVGCYLDVMLQYVRGTLEMAPYPQNIQVKLARTAGVNSPVETPFVISPGGRASTVVFQIAPGNKIEVYGYVSAKAIATDRISPVSGTMKVNNKPYLNVPGERFGFVRIPKVSDIKLYDKQDFTLNSLPIQVVEVPVPRLHYDAYDSMADNYGSIPADDKLAVCFNWFIEFVAYRNLYIRTMNLLLKFSAHVHWAAPSPIPLPLTLHIDDSMGMGRANTLAQVITAYLELILRPTDDVCTHELTHALANQYFANESSSVYYPAKGQEHELFSYSNELFAFQEGFAQFIASLFIDPNQAYFTDTSTWDWRHFFVFQFEGMKAGKYFPVFGATSTRVLPLEASAGMALEAAFAGALLQFWVEVIWKNRWPQAPNDQSESWVQNLTGDGRLDTTATQNAWLLDSGLQKKFANYIIDPIVDAGRVTGKISTRRVVDRIEKITTPVSAQWADISWSVLSRLFESFSVINEPFVSAIVDAAGVENIIVRSSSSAFEYSPPLNKHISFKKSATNVLTVRGIRLPATLGCKIKQDFAGPISGTISFSTEYEVTFAFSAADSDGLSVGTGTLLFETNPGQPGNESFLVKSLKVTS
jgi:hypothetical protein